MPIVAKLDELGKPAWIALMVLGFVIWWPLGLATLFYLIGSGRMGPWNGAGSAHWQGRMQRKMQRMRQHMEGAGCGWHGAPPSGNRAFDEYREETLRRLEQEQREFYDFLARLRAAKDKAEFDAFMAERRDGQPPQGAPTQAP
ncbi:MAG: DUF2852 domain-containing protein [Proteobacteria bacterium]|nr:DUF2852 domain-containing protein [Pseudomonadota bacterium]